VNFIEFIVVFRYSTRYMTIECKEYRTEIAGKPEQYEGRIVRYLRYDIHGRLQIVLGREVDIHTQQTEITTITFDNTQFLEQVFESEIPAVEYTDMGTIRTDRSSWDALHHIVELMDVTPAPPNASSHDIVFLSLHVFDHTIGPVSFGLGRTPSRVV